MPPEEEISPAVIVDEDIPSTSIFFEKNLQHQISFNKFSNMQATDCQSDIFELVMPSTSGVKRTRVPELDTSEPLPKLTKVCYFLT